MFNMTESVPSIDFPNMIKNLFGGTSIASITLTVINFLAALAAIILILVDNRRVHKTWKIAPSLRIPLSLAVAICISHVFFMTKAFIGLGAFHMPNPPKNERVACQIFNELGFWGLLSL